MSKEEKKVEEEVVESGVTKDHPLCTVKGIGPKTAEKLIEKNITTVEQVAIMRSEELADVIGITNKAAKDIVNVAKNMALDTESNPVFAGNTSSKTSAWMLIPEHGFSNYLHFMIPLIIIRMLLREFKLEAIYLMLL